MVMGVGSVHSTIPSIFASIHCYLAFNVEIFRVCLSHYWRIISKNSGKSVVKKIQF